MLYFFLGPLFAGVLTFDTYSVNVFTQSFGYLAAVWIAWKIARERIVWALMPTTVFWLMVLAVTFEGVASGSFHVRSWLTVAGIAIGTLIFGLFLGRHTQVSRDTEPAEPLPPQ